MGTPQTPANIAQAIAWSLARGLERLDAQLLVLHALERKGHGRAWLLAHDTDALPADAFARLKTAVLRRSRNEPLAYITGHQEFFGLDFLVDDRVLVPRPDTETLVDWALDLLTPSPATAHCHLPETLLDLGTGSGAIALAVKHARPALRVTAVDFSTQALAVATTNAQRLQLDVQLVHSNWFDNVQGPFNLIVSNPPYIAAADHHLDALTCEPLQALASGTDGLDDIRTIITQAPVHLLPGGWLLLEHGYDQAPAVRSLLRASGLQDVQSRRDLAGIERCSGARLAPA
jgi:release factor glutamine methyltransferase